MGERGVSFVKDFKCQSVEPDQAFLRAEPEVAVARLRYGRNRILWQAVLGGPGIQLILGNGLAGIEKETRDILAEAIRYVG